MNREILFRAWDTERNDMIYSGVEYTLRCIDDNNLPTYDDSFIGYKDNNRFKHMQAVGLPDKNGTPIYEGDILEIVTDAGRKERFRVQWGIHRRDMKSGYTVDIPGFSFVSSEGFPTFPISNNYLNGHDLDIIEVVGNIYE